MWFMNKIEGGTGISRSTTAEELTKLHQC